MNLNQLRVFLIAAREGNQTAAAKTLRISQPAVAKALRRLQQEQGIQLFLRDGNRLRVTEAGEQLYEIAQEIFDHEDRADALMAELREQEHSILRVDSSLSFGDYYMPTLIHEFSKKMPMVHASVTVMSTSDIIPRILKMQSDVAFCSYDLDNPDLITQPVVREKLVITTKPDHRFAKLKYVTPEDLNGETIISHEPGSVQKQVIDDLIVEHHLDLNLRAVDYTSNEAIKAAIDLGEGIALMSEKVVDREVKTGHLYALPLGKKPLTRKLYMAWHKDRIITPKIQALMDVCEEQLSV